MRTYAYHVKHRNGWGTGFGPKPTHCHKCACELPAPKAGEITTGYGCGKPELMPWPDSEFIPDKPILKHGESIERSPAFCYQCCADDERARMIETGRAMLYLTQGKGKWLPEELQAELLPGRADICRMAGRTWIVRPKGQTVGNAGFYPRAWTAIYVEATNEGQALRDAARTTAVWSVTDWPGKLSFPVTSISKGRHNMARTRYDVTFIGPDGKPWRGTQYGENTQICHCRRIGGKR